MSALSMHVSVKLPVLAAIIGYPATDKVMRGKSDRFKRSLSGRAMEGISIYADRTYDVIRPGGNAIASGAIALPPGLPLLLTFGGRSHIPCAEQANANAALQLILFCFGGGSRGFLQLHTRRGRLLAKTDYVNRACRNVVFHEVTLHGPGPATAQVEIVTRAPPGIGEARDFDHGARHCLHLCCDRIEFSLRLRTQCGLIEGEEDLALIHQLIVQ